MLRLTMSSFLLSLIALFSALCSVLGAPSRLQYPMTEDEPDAYHIGMDLSASYGAVAVGFSNNDTIVSVARVEGSEEYKSLMAELSRQEKWEPVGPWIPVDPRHTAILSKMITALKVRAEEQLDLKINSTLVASTPLPYLYDQIIHASILDAGLEDMDGTHTWLGCSFKQPQAVMAGSGIGMCHKWWDYPACDHEIGSWPRENPITILYTSNALCVSMGFSKGAYGYQSSHSYPSSMDFTLGYDERSHNPNESFYWEAVRERIMRGALGSTALKPMNPTVWVHGDKDAVNNLKFRQVLKRAIYDILQEEPPIYFPDDPEYIAARGAALILREGKYTG